MLSAAEDLKAGNVRYYAPAMGVVVDNADPEGNRRVRVRVPGLVEKSAWAWPITGGGGSARRGSHVVPAVGADVVVQFLGGDVERPIYSGGPWSAAAQAGDERSEDVVEAGEGAHKVQTLELEDLRITVDERDGNRAIRLLNKRTQDFITIDVVAGGLQVRMTSAILIQCLGLVSIEAAAITLNERPVLPDSAPI
jgi:hypothetical protein